MTDPYTFGVDLVYGGRKEAVWREDYDKVVADLADRTKANEQLAAIGQRQYDRILDLEGVVARKTALIHRLVEELRKRMEAAKP